MVKHLFEPADLGAGELHVVIRITRPDGSAEELTIHKVVIDPEADDNHGLSLKVENDYGEDIVDGIMLRKDTTKLPIKTMEVRFRGRLDQADPDKDELYRVIHTTAPEEGDRG